MIRKRVLMVLFVALLGLGLAACAQSQMTTPEATTEEIVPTAAPVEPTATEAIVPTGTPVEPTATEVIVPTNTAVEPTATEADALPATGANEVQVGLTEYAINMPEQVPAGTTRFVVTNNGSVAHNFEIEGQNLKQEFEPNLQPGETREMQVTLEPGTYTIYCPVDGHRGRGMELTLTVSETGAAGGEPAATETPEMAPTATTSSGGGIY